MLDPILLLYLLFIGCRQKLNLQLHGSYNQLLLLSPGSNLHTLAKSVPNLLFLPLCIVYRSSPLSSDHSIFQLQLFSILDTYTFLPSLQPLPPPPRGDIYPPPFSVDNHLEQQERLTGGPTPNAVNGQRSSVVAPPAYEPLRRRSPEVCLM